MTLAEFRDHLASDLGVKAEGNALSASRANYLETVIENCQGELEQLGVALWSSDDIPAYAVESFVIYCKGTISRFGFDPDPGAKFVALSMLRGLTSDAQTGTGTACYF